MINKFEKKIIKLFIGLLTFLALFFLLRPQIILAESVECVWKNTSKDLNTNVVSGGCSQAERLSCFNQNTKQSLCPAVAGLRAGMGCVTQTVGNTQLSCQCCPTVAQLAQPPDPRFTIPDLQIKIDTVKFSEVKCTPNQFGEPECAVPWIAEYIQGIYQYSLGIAGILAAIVLMAGGLIWLVSAGSADRINQAKSLIAGSLTGLFLLVGSYLILYQINPDLVILKPIQLNRIDRYIMPDAEVVGDGQNPYAAACAAAKQNDWSLCEKLGNTIPAGLIEYKNNIFVHQDVLNKFLAVIDCVAAKNDGDKIFDINYAWRSPANQIRIKKEMEAAGKGNYAATPCCSNHGSGMAIDLKRLDGQKTSWSHNDSSGLTECMNNQGLYAELKGVPDEPWHWSPTGR